MLQQTLSLMNLTANIQVLEDIDYTTGSSWISSQVTIQKLPGTIQVSASRLLSVTWVPVFGGMNYCKILSTRGLSELMNDSI